MSNLLLAPALAVRAARVACTFVNDQVDAPTLLMPVQLRAYFDAEMVILAQRIRVER